MHKSLGRTESSQNKSKIAKTETPQVLIRYMYLMNIEHKFLMNLKVKY